MDVLVSGGTGFLGRALCGELVDRGHDVTALARDPTRVDLPSGVETAIGDVTAFDSIVAQFEGRDVVVNLVALSPLFKPRGGSRKHFEVHLGGTENCVQAAREHGVDRFIQLSGLGADPDGPTAFLRAKGQAEDVVREVAGAWTIFRPSVVFGDGGEFVSFTRRLAPWPVAPLPGGGHTEFQPVWVADLVEIIASATESEAHAGEVYEIGGPRVLRLAEVAKLAHRAEGRTVRILPVPMALAGVGLTLAGTIPGFPLGADQYRSLKLDHTVPDNDVSAFDRNPADLKTLSDYLGLDGSQ